MLEILEMKIKIFTGGDNEDLEEEVNEFINLEGVSVTDILFSSSEVDNNVLIIYTQKEDLK